MPERPRKKRPRDTNVLAQQMVQESLGETPPEPPEPEKDPHAVALGQKGGKKGGKARAEKMSSIEDSKSAKKAALARWRAAKNK
ncbi:MAG: hypothetical protein E2O38_01910 [Proteobacteria bacterium]|nr:MAG: hypothetical protein E2O38_01910 [Pseudomonadota bacterium]